MMVSLLRERDMIGIREVKLLNNGRVFPAVQVTCALRISGGENRNNQFKTLFYESARISRTLGTLSVKLT